MLAFSHLLRQYGVDISQWDRKTAKGVAELWREVQRGEVELRLDETGALTRCLSVVKVRVCRPETPNEHLVEAYQIWPNGRERVRGHLLSETLLQDETPVQGALRGLVEELGGLATSSDVSIHASSTKTWIESFESPSYPTLRSQYTLHELSAVVRGLPSTSFRTEERCDEYALDGAEGLDSLVHVWAWRKDVDVLVKKLRHAILEKQKQKGGKQGKKGRASEPHPAALGHPAGSSSPSSPYMWNAHGADSRGRGRAARNALGRRWDRSQHY